MAKHLITIVGPTAIGKTALSIAVAKHLNCEIISCDSRQFYKEMTIGTAVPSLKELNSVPHHFIQNKSMFEKYTVGDFEKEAIAKLSELFKINDFAVLVGGSGLYVDAVIKGFDDFPAINPEVRKSLTENLQLYGIGYLQAKLEQLDPIHYKIIEKENPQRLMRALEVCISSEKPYSSFLNIKTNTREFTPLIIGITAERDVIYERINKRVDQMMQGGLLAEAKKIFPHKELNALQTVGYKELFNYLDKNISLEIAIQDIKKNTRRFAKRQMTWFKTCREVQWFNFNVEKIEVFNHINFKVNNIFPPSNLFNK